MSTLAVYDPPMCCSTGVCGPAVDPILPRFAADLDWLGQQGVIVTRYNLAQQPGAFAQNPLVRGALQEKGNACLPLILVDDRIVRSGAYPSRDELLGFLGISGVLLKTVTLDSPEVKELIAIGAAIAANCLACFKFHHTRATELGVPLGDIATAVDIALAVKKTADEHVVQLADKTLFPEEDRLAVEAPSRGGPDSRSSSGPCCG